MPICSILAASVSLASSGSFVKTQVPGYVPFSFVPSMSFGSDPASVTIPSGANFSETAWVADLDEWTQNGTGTIVRLGNPATWMEKTINSGSLLSTSQSFDASTGKHTFAYTIKAKTVTYSASYIDLHWGEDRGTNTILQDANTGATQVLVTITAPESQGPTDPPPPELVARSIASKVRKNSLIGVKKGKMPR